MQPITLEITIDMDSPEIQAMMREAADEFAVRAASVGHGSLVIQALDKARADTVGPTHAFDHMIAAIERRVGRLEHAVKVEVEVLASWARRNPCMALTQDTARRLRLNDCASAALWDLGQRRAERRANAK